MTDGNTKLFCIEAEDDSDGLECPECLGEGSFPEDDWDCDGEHVTSEITCSRCNGTGFIDVIDGFGEHDD